MFSKSTLVKGLFSIYIFTLIFLVFFTSNRYRSDNYGYNIHFIPLQSTIRGLHRTPGEHFWPYWIGYAENLIGNIVLFIPMGFFLKALSRRSIWHIVAIGALVSIAIEVLQLVFKIGVCDTDDVMLNTLGAMFGAWLWRGVKVVAYKD